MWLGERVSRRGFVEGIGGGYGPVRRIFKAKKMYGVRREWGVGGTNLARKEGCSFCLSFSHGVSKRRSENQQKVS